MTSKRKLKRSIIKQVNELTKKKHLGEHIELNPLTNKKEWVVSLMPLVKDDEGSIVIANTNYSRKRQHYGN